MTWARWGLLGLLLAGCSTHWPCGALVSNDRCPGAHGSHVFSEANLCPRERLTVRERKDLPLHVFACHDLAPEDRRKAGIVQQCVARPSATVASDPERLALWRRLHEEAFRRYDDEFGPVVEVSGCGKRRFYTCPLGHGRHGGLGIPYNNCEAEIDLGDQDPADAEAHGPSVIGGKSDTSG